MPASPASSPCTLPCHQTGFNLVELLVVLVIAGVLLGVAVPAGQGIVERAQLRAATNDVYSALLFARNEATRLRRDIRLCFVHSATSTSCSSPGSSTLLSAFVLDSSDTPAQLIRSFEINSNVDINLEGVAQYIQFQSLGNRQEGNSAAVYFVVEISGNHKEVESCFNGRILIRESAGMSQC